MITARVDDLFDDGDDGENYDLRASEIYRDQQLDSRRYTSGLTNLDETVNPYRAGEFVVLGAREGNGKTAYAERFALYNSDEHKVLFVTLEMSRRIIQDRMLAKCMLVSQDEVNESGRINSAEFNSGMDILRKRDVLIWQPDEEKATIQRIVTKAEDVSAEILIIDYCALITGWEPGGKARAIVNQLAAWAHRSMTNTLLLSQLKDDAIQQKRRPNNGDFSDTSRLRQAADRTQLLHRPYNGAPTKDTICEVLTTKNRFGPTAMNHVGWTGLTLDYYAFNVYEESQARCCQRSRKADKTNEVE
jgi:replicative DNA helicase